jgi:two-component system, sensor histidine kinase PdtaS
MAKALLFVTLLACNNLIPFHGLSQSARHAPSSAMTKTAALSLTPSEQAVPWQRLLLQLSSAYLTILKEFQVDFDSNLLYTSHSLGLSRLPVIAEGFDPEVLPGSTAWIDKRDPTAALRILPGLHGIPHLRLMVLLGAYYAFQPATYYRYKDSAVFFLSRSREESKALHEPKWGRQALCLLGKVFVAGNALEQGSAIFEQLTDECRAAGDLDNEAKAWMCRGLYNAYSPGSTKDRIFYLEKAKELYRRQKNPEGEISALMNIGYLWVTDLQLTKGEQAFRQALDMEDSIGFPYTHYTTNAIAMATLFEGKYGEPLKYALQTVKTAEAVKDSVGWGVFYGRMGVLYSLPGNRNAESLQWMEKSLDRFILTGGDPSLYRNLGNMVDLLAENGRAAEALARAQHIAKLSPPSGPAERLGYHLILGECYTALKEYDLAEKNYLEAAQLEKEVKPMRGSFSRGHTTARIGMFYFSAGRYSSAKKYFQQFLSDPSHLNVPLKMTMDVQKMLFVMDSASGQYPSAIRHFERYLQLLDSNFSISERRQVEELGIQYETEKKENDIKIRDQHIQSLTQADLLRQASLKRADLIKNITIAGIGVLLIIGGLLYRQYRQKQKVNEVITSTNKVITRTNELITQKNEVITRKNKLLEHLVTEKEWLLKEVHHRVKNNLHTVISLLESQADHLENDALKAIENSQHRIYAMSMIHQKIYQSEDIRTIDMADYLSEFIRYLRDSFGRPAHIRVQLNIEALKFGVSQAIPVALIINEAVTNSIKYAFPGNRTGEIIIELYQIEEQIKLSVTDNGIGIDPVLIDAELNSLGIELIKGLSLELEGKITIETEEGTRIVVLFKPDLLYAPGALLLRAAEEEVVT